MMQTENKKFITKLWLLLISLTLFSAFMAERSHPGLLSVLIMAGVLAFKGRIIVDYFMELKQANPVLRKLMQMYFYVIPTLIILSWLFPQQIAEWTAL